MLYIEQSALSLEQRTYRALALHELGASMPEPNKWSAIYSCDLPIIRSMIISLVVTSYHNFQCRSITMLGELLFILKGKCCEIGAYDPDLSDSICFL